MDPIDDVLSSHEEVESSILVLGGALQPAKVMLQLSHQIGGVL
jgi:hypothetical protein